MRPNRHSLRPQRHQGQSLGTSLGDYLADSSGLGYAGGAAVIGTALVVVAALTSVPMISDVVLFWLAFILTRPLGATVGDFFSKPSSKGGSGFGTYDTSAVLLVVLVSGVV